MQDGVRKQRMSSSFSDDLRAGALVYHRLPRPGKLEIQPTKPLANQRDLALAYSPGVAAASEAIAADPAQAAELTSRANLVAVVTNGTAVLGLGNIGPLAAKPVMEGKAVLFKKFAGIDGFDIEIAATEVDHIVSVVAALEPTFGGINLEDFKAPECFEVEAQLKARMKIPVFHDDQHGTAIIVSAAVQNALALSGKKIGKVKIVTSGAGRRRWPVSICSSHWAPSARTSGSPISRASSMRAARNSWTAGNRSTRRRPSIAR